MQFQKVPESNEWTTPNKCHKSKLCTAKWKHIVGAVKKNCKSADWSELKDGTQSCSIPENPFYFNILLPFSFLLQKPILLPHFFAQQLLIQLSIILLLVTFDSEHLCNISLITLQLYLLRAPQAVCREKKKRFHNFNIWKYSLHNLTPQSCMSRLPWKQWIWQIAILQV